MGSPDLLISMRVGVLYDFPLHVPFPSSPWTGEPHKNSSPSQSIAALLVELAAILF